MEGEGSGQDRLGVRLGGQVWGAHICPERPGVETWETSARRQSPRFWEEMKEDGLYFVLKAST